MNWDRFGDVDRGLSQLACLLRDEISSVKAKLEPAPLSMVLLLLMLSCHEGAIGNLQAESQAPAAEKK
jgi:hypothetical protein